MNMHPAVARSKNRPRAMGVFVVYGKEGQPKLDPDFIAHLNEHQRKTVDADLAAHGFRLNANNVAERI